MSTPNMQDDLDDLLRIDPTPARVESPAPVDDVDDLLPDIDSGPAVLADPEPVAVVEPVAEPEKPKRTRRTKAEIEAASATVSEAAEPSPSLAIMAEATVPDPAGLSQAEAEAAYFAMLQARLKNPAERPTSEAQLTPLQRQIREAEEAVAVQEVKHLDAAAPQYVAPKDTSNSFLIHVLHDGLVINGTAVYRGQEFRFTPGEPAYEQTKDRYGDSFLDLRDDVEAQYARWGEQKIASGPWRGKRSGYSVNDAPRELKAEEKAQWVLDMNANAYQEQARNQAAPMMPIY